MSRPINLTTITERSTLAQINSNFRKIQEEISGFRRNVEPRLRASEEYQDYFSRYLGGGRPISRQQAIEYTDEQIAVKEAEILDELESRTGNIGEKIEELEQLGEDLIDRISTADEVIESHAETIEAIESDLSNTRDRLEEKADLLWTEAQLALKADQSLFEETVSSLEDTISEKADIEWVDGQLVEKVNISDYEEKVQHLISDIAGKAEISYVDGQLSLKVDQEVYEEKVQELISDLSDKADLEYVDGQLVDKVNKGEVYIIEEIDHMFENVVSVTQYETDINGIVTNLTNHESRISQTESSLESKVERTEFEVLEDELDNVGFELSTAKTQIQQNSNLIETKASQESVNTLSGEVSFLSSTVSQHANLIEQRVTKTEYIQDQEGIIEQLEQHETKITQTETAIESKVEQSVFDSTTNILENRLSSVEQTSEGIQQSVSILETDFNSFKTTTQSTFVQHADLIEQRISREEYTHDFNGIIDELEIHESRISQTEFSIESKVEKTEFNALEDEVGNLGSKIANAFTAIQQNANEIALKASQSSVDTLAGEVENLESELSVQAGRIASKVEQSEFDSTTNTLSNRVTSVEQIADGIVQEVSQVKTDVESLEDNVTGEISDLRTSISQNAEQIELRATRSEVERLEVDLDEVNTRVSEAETLIIQNTEQIELRATKSELDEVTNRVSTAETAITQNAEAIEQRASKTEVDELSGDVSSLSSTVTQHANLIEQKVDSTTYTQDMDGVTQQLSNHSTAITQNAEAIGLKASQTEVDALNDTVSQHAAQLAVHADAIEAKVDNIEYEQDQAGIIQRIEANEAEITATAQGLELRVTKEEFENLEIGGRNVIPDSNNFSKWRLYQGAQRSIESGVALEEANIYNASKVTLTGGSHELKTYISLTNYVIRGEEYTFSLHIKNVGNSPLQVRTHAMTPSTNVIVEQGQYIRIAITRTIAETGSPQIQIRALQVNDELEFIIGNLKMEKGNKATDWTPAPEDTDEAITAVSNRVSQTETTLTAHAGLIEAKAEKSEVYTRSQVDDALGEKIDTTIFNEQIGTLTTSINSISGRVSSTEAEINSLTGELENVENRISSVEVTTDGITQSVSSIEGELSSVGNRLSQAETSITSLADEIELKASQTEVDTIQSTLDAAVATLNVLPGMISAKVDRNGVISAINLSPESAKIQADIIEFEGHVFGQDATFTGTVEGATIIGSTFIAEDEFGNTTYVGPYGISLSDNDPYMNMTTGLMPNGLLFQFGPHYSLLRMVETAGPTLRLENADLIVENYLGVGDLGVDSLSVSSFNNVLWQGQVYPTASQTITPSKQLTECTTGWILRFQAYVVGTGTQNSNFQYVHIPKIHGNGFGIRLNLRVGNYLVNKYVYVYADRIEGHADNNQGDNSRLALTGVYEY